MIIKFLITISRYWFFRIILIIYSEDYLNLFQIYTIYIYFNFEYSFSIIYLIILFL